MTDSDLKNTKTPDFTFLDVKSGVCFCKTLIFNAYCGADGTRTRDPMRDRHVF